MISSPVIVGKNLKKNFGEFAAVKGIDFEIQKGSCFGFLGPNGAGKTTTMRMIHLVSSITSGSLTVFGEDVTALQDRYAFKKRIGIVHQEDNLDQSLTVEDTLLVFCRFYGLFGKMAQQRCDELLQQIHLTEKRKATVLQLSGGMRRRLQIARSLIGHPELVILDEPTTGLDPNIRNELWNQLKILKQKGVTLILTTHYMYEAEQLCDDLVIMNHGKIIARGHPRDLVKTHVSQWVFEVLLPLDQSFSSGDIEKLCKSAKSFQILADRVFLFTENRDSLANLIQADFPKLDYSIRHGTLEDVFVKLTGQSLEQG